jgi:hypothetical protein
MAIIQNIEFKSENRYFAGFLQNAIDSSGIEGSVEFHNGTVTLTLEDRDSEKLESFIHFTQKYLPHSIFIGEIETAQDTLSPNKKSRFQSPPYPIAPCPICLEELSSPESDKYLDDTISCLHYSNVEASLYEDNTIFSPNYNSNDTVLLTDSSKIEKLFYINDNEMKALFSIEKPSLLLPIRDEELKSIIGKEFIRVKTPYSIRSALVAINARDSGIDTLFFDENEYEPKVVVVNEYLSMVYDNRVSTKLKSLHSDSIINRFLNIKAETAFDTVIGVNLSRKGISFIVSNKTATKKVIEFKKFDIKELLDEMKRSDVRAKLLSNFGKRYPNLIESLERRDDCDIFETISIVLGIDEVGFEAIGLKSLKFSGDSSLKVDMNFNDDGFDYSSMIGSIMSFRLAGVDTHHLSYSILEAYGDMTISVLNQLKSRFKIENFILFGDMFADSTIFKRVLSRFTISKPYISRAVALDARS